MAEAPEGMVDACFAYDPVFVTGAGAIELRMAKPARRAEPAFLAAEVEKAGVPVVGRLTGPATADGGDMFWLDDTTLAVGRSYRTNAAAHAAARRDPRPRGRDRRARGPAAPPRRGPRDAPDVAWCRRSRRTSPWSSSRSRRCRCSSCWPTAATARVPADPDELDDQGCNVLAVRPGVVVMADSAPRTRAALEEAGVEVHTYAAAQINKGDGGPTCLTRPLLRG